MNEKYWQKAAKQTALKANFGAWLSAFFPVLITSTLLLGIALLVLRQQRLSPEPAWLAYGAVLLLGALLAGWMARRRFFNRKDALVQLDVAMHLHNRLTSAEAGVTPWPAPPAQLYTGLNWNPRRILMPFCAAALIVLLAAWIPLPPPSAPDKAAATEKPLAWTQLEEIAKQLSETQTVEEQSLEKLRDQLNQLAGQDPKDWFSHSSLEAGDNLREETMTSLGEMQKHLETAADALAAMEKFGDGLSQEQVQQLAQALSDALKGLENGKFALDKKTMDKLKGLNPNALKSMDPKKLAELADQLKKNAQTCSNCTGGDGNDGNKDGSGLGKKSQITDILGQKQTLGSQGYGPGGGGGPAALQHKDRPTELGTKTTEELAAGDDSRATLGDALALSSGKHDMDESAGTQNASGGAIASQGQGGDIVGRENLPPKEQTVIERFFQ